MCKVSSKSVISHFPNLRKNPLFSLTTALNVAKKMVADAMYHAGCGKFIFIPKKNTVLIWAVYPTVRSQGRRQDYAEGAAEARREMPAPLRSGVLGPPGCLGATRGS